MTNEIELLFAEPMSYEHYGLRVVKVDGEEYAVADTDAQAETAAIEAARSSLWAFNASFIGSFLGLSDDQAKAIGVMQEKLYEDADTIIELLLGTRLGDFLSDAVATDGRGHFLNNYDGEEVDGEDVSPAFEGKYLYRIS